MNTFKLNTLVFLLLTSLPSVSLNASVKKTFVDIETVKALCKSIYTQATGDSFVPDFIIGLSRGGLIPLGFLAGETMFNNRNVKTISITSYSDEGQQSNLKLLFPISDEELHYLGKFKSILIIDDLVDSGKSLSWITNLLKKSLPNSNIKTAALFYKKRSIFKPDYYVEETEDWIVFPWEV